MLKTSCIGRCNVLLGTLLDCERVNVNGAIVQAQDRADGLQIAQSVALSVRPHSIVMHPIDCAGDSSGINCFIVQVEQQDYFGGFREYKVRLEQSELSLSVVTSPDIRYQVGDRLAVKISTRALAHLSQSSLSPQSIKTEVLSAL